MKSSVLILIAILISSQVSFSQTNSELLSVQLSASIQTTPAPQITIDWINDGTGSAYTVYRRVNTSSTWGASVASLGGSATTYVDNSISIGTAYEYKVQKTGATFAYGYINTSIELPAVTNKGILILVVEDTYVGNANFDAAINETIKDIENDGWIVERLDVNQSDAVTTVKASIVSIYNQNTSLTKAIYIIGHVPVPYSGLLNPDGHPDHLGAWPTDGYYADVNGSWTDVSVNDNTSAAQARNYNIPGDGKFDQTVIASTELQIGRVDFTNMSTFSETEEELLIKYLNKAHEYKMKKLVAMERALIDDNFVSMPEGFSSSGFRNFSTMFTPGNVSTSVDLRTATNNGSYMWSYGCGAGSYTSCSGIGTTTNLASDSLQTIFAILFGSYFGDWDSNNNFLRAVIAQGQTLNSFWAGRPQWQVHHMALGENIGYSSWLTQNNSSNYFATTLAGYFAKWVHISLMGDPTVRMTYLVPPTNLTVTNNNNDADLTWTASPDATIGYNVYRLDANASSYVKLNSNPVVGTTYTDNTIVSGGLITYIVKAANLKTTASGSYYNQSLGIRNAAIFTVGIDNNEIDQLSIFPNPTKGTLNIDVSEIKKDIKVTLTNSLGQVILIQKFISDDIIELTFDGPKGIYFLQLEIAEEEIIRKKIIKD